MTFTFTLRAGQDCWTATMRGPDGRVTAPARVLRRGAQDFPHPPADEQATWPAGAAALCADLTDAALVQRHTRIRLGDPEAGDVTAFGDYLGAVLIGPWWPAIVALVPTGPLALELDIPADDYPLQRLPWEMAMQQGVPLAAFPTPGRRIALTRVIETSEPIWGDSVALPLRVLFAVSGQLDERLRPGAEYLGLLRQFNMTVRDATGATGTALRTRLIQQTTRQALSDAIDEFKPAVVHIVAHGAIAEAGPRLELSRDEDGQPDPIDAAGLIGLLRGRADAVRTVRAVVISACHSGEPDTASVSFAAALVRQGIPVAVGMSGEVADRTCRIFTRAFYRALIEARDLDAACADARRAAMLFEGANFMTSVEWARPALLRAAGATLVFEENVDEMRQASAAAAFHLRAPSEMLCGRMNAMQAFQDLCSRTRKGGPTGLAFEVTQANEPADENNRVARYGKSWLIGDLAAQAALEGFVPCVLPSNTASEIPANLLLLAVRLAEEMNNTRAKYNVEPRRTSFAQELAFSLFDDAPPAPPETADARAAYGRAVAKVKRNLRQPRPDGAAWADQANVEEAIRMDLGQLIDDVSPGAPAMILVDDLHRYEGVALPFLAALRTHGLGTRDMPAPLVFTYLTRDKTGGHILDELRGRSAQIRREPLTNFAQPEEAILACRQYILSRKWAPNSIRHYRQQFVQLLNYGKDQMRGVPSYLPILDNLIAICGSAEILIAADDEEMFRQRREADAV